MLLVWVKEVRRLCATHDRVEIGDQHIGQLLSRAAADPDGKRPSSPVCEVMEEIASQQMGVGFSTGVQDARGVELRGKGGVQERDLAAEYRRLAKQRAFDFPFVSGVLESVAADHERMAKWWDDEAEIEMGREH